MQDRDAGVVEYPPRAAAPSSSLFQRPDAKDNRNVGWRDSTDYAITKTISFADWRLASPRPIQRVAVRRNMPGQLWRITRVGQ